MNVDVLIIGAGPAGLAAAQTLSEHSLSVCMVDEAEGPGGQIHRGRPDLRGNGGGSLWRRIAGTDSHSHLVPPAVSFLPGTTALGFEEHAGLESGWDALTGLVAEDSGGRHAHRVWINSKEGGGLRPIDATAVLIATGAYDLPVPVPGWQLPGVMGIGGLETLLKSGGFDGGSRAFVLCGSHPLLLLTAHALLEQGHRVECVALELHPTWHRVIKTLPGPAALSAKLPLLAASLTALAKAHVPVRWDARLTEVAVDGPRLRAKFQHGKVKESFAGDHVGLGYGFLANTHLARQAGCECTFALRDGGWTVQGHHQRTSIPGIFVAGEQTGISGAEAAASEGCLAGLMIAASLGSSSVTSIKILRAARRVKKWNRMGRFLRECAHHDEAWLESRLSGDSVMCRCEGLTLSDVIGSGSAALSNLRQTKLTTRVGMGPCQGRICGPVLSALAIRARTDPGGLSPRFPIEPITVHANSHTSEEK